MTNELFSKLQLANCNRTSITLATGGSWADVGEDSLT